jgi:hypothetical protein
LKLVEAQQPPFGEQLSGHHLQITSAPHRPSCR